MKILYHYDQSDAHIKKKLMLSSKELDMIESEILIYLKFFFFFYFSLAIFFC